VGLGPLLGLQPFEYDEASLNNGLGYGFARCGVLR
jgi:hypothetical protein